MTQFGTFSRLISPFEGEGNACAWQIASQDGSEVFIWYYKPYAEPEEAYIRVHPVGLDAKAMYTDAVTGRRITGSMAMHMGLTIDWKNGDRFCQMWRLVKESSVF